jgi:DNA-binding NarL/FixJ family response regulator
MSAPGILIADDHPLFREALKLAVSQVLADCIIHEADSVASLFAALERLRQIDLLLLDLAMPGAQGFSALVQARAHYPAVPVVVISGRDDARIVERTLAHGAAGFVPKSSPVDSIVEAIKSVLRGELWIPRRIGSAPDAQAVTLDRSEADAASRLAKLTPQQFRVLSMVSAGLLNKQIAAELELSEATVKAHMTAIMQKLGAGNRTQAVLFAQKLALDESALPPRD